MAPELFTTFNISFESDIWALGVILYRLCMLKIPFDDTNIFSVAEKIKQGIYVPIPEGKYSAGLIELQKKMLMK